MLKTKRVAVLGLLHESNTFLPAATHYEDFAAASLERGERMLARWSGAPHEFGGMIDGLREAGIEIVPGMAAFAIPSGVIAAADYERLVAELLDSLGDPAPLDGVLIALHGATVSEEYPDADGEILRRLRGRVGAGLPVIATLDLHANISAAMAAHTTALIVYRSNPHLDQRERGLEAARLMDRVLQGNARPVQALETPPLLIQLSRQNTAAAPASGLYQDVAEVCSWPGILSASTAMGFYYADVAEMGAGFLAVTDGDAALARRAARWLAGRAWARRAEFSGSLPSPAEAVREALAESAKPVVLLDVGDNVGGGSPADSTILFDEIRRQKGRNALVILCDPSAVEACVHAGVRHTVRLEVGAKTGALHGRPVAIEGRVRTISDGIFVETEVRHGGWGGGDQGVTAVLETPENHTLVLTSHRMAPMSLEQLRSLGIDPRRKDVLIVKGVVAPRAAYAPVAQKFILAGTPGATSDDPRSFTYARRRRPLYPLENDASYGEGPA
jgi:microcystin degradation protein MlrC